METTIMGYMGTTTRIHSFIPSQPKVRKSGCVKILWGLGFGIYAALDLGFKILEGYLTFLFFCGEGGGCGVRDYKA